MKRLISAVFLVVIAAVAASAQIRIEQNFWRKDFVARVTNATEDEATIEVSNVGGDKSYIVPAGKYVELDGGPGLFLFWRNGSVDVAIVFKACESVERTSVEPHPWFAWMENE